MNKKLANARAQRILWIDLEMTGLNPAKDRILEVGAIITDWDFNEVAVYEGVVKASSRLVERQMKKGPAREFWESVPAVRDALIAQNLTQGRPRRVIEKELLELVKTHFNAKVPVLLAGNSIHMDRQFITREWPRLNARLHYRMLDVSAWKVVFEGRFRKKFAKAEAHRALEDIRGSIEELKYYVKSVKL